MTDDKRTEALLEALAAFKMKGKPSNDEDFENRLAFADVNQSFIERVVPTSEDPQKRLAVQMAWTQFLMISGLVSPHNSPQIPTLPTRRAKRAYAEQAAPTGLVHQAPPPAFSPQSPPIVTTDKPANPETSSPADIPHQPLSVVLPKFLSDRRKIDADGRAEDNVAPIIRFVISLLSDPSLTELRGDNLRKLREAMSDIPTNFGFKIEERDLYTRWRIARECNFRRTGEDGRQVALVRVSKSTLNNRYGAGLRAMWAWAKGLDTSLGDPPNFSAATADNPGKGKRDAFRPQELIRLVSIPLFQGCARPPLIWKEGLFFYQNYFYWSVLITLLAGLRPGEISQLRCRDVVELYGSPHFRFARFSDSDDSDDDDERRPGGNQGKSDAAFRWVPIHPLLIRLGIIERRDAIVADYISSKDRRSREPDQTEAALTAEDQWLFPDWKVYLKKNGVMMWSQAVSKAWGHLKDHYAFDRYGITFYSARHTFKGFIDDYRGLSTRSRRIIMGHADGEDVHDKYGPKQITEEQTEIMLQIDNGTIPQISRILISAKEKAERKQLITTDAWRKDARSNDPTFQSAIKKRRKEYR